MNRLFVLSVISAIAFLGGSAFGLSVMVGFYQFSGAACALGLHWLLNRVKS